MEEKEVKVNDSYPESNNKIKNDSTNIHNKDKEKEPGEWDGEEHAYVKKKFLIIWK